MQGGHPVDGAVKALKELRQAYEALLDMPSDAAVDCCRQCHRRVVDCLKDQTLDACVTGLIKQTRESQQATPKFALRNLVRNEPWECKAERELGQALGFTPSQVDAFVEEAKRGLESAISRKKDPSLPEKAAGLAGILDALHEPTVQLAGTLRKVSKNGALERKPSRREKRKGKRQARKLTSRQLFVVGSIVANGKVESVFPRSYAISLGLVAAAER